MEQTPKKGESIMDNEEALKLNANKVVNHFSWGTVTDKYIVGPYLIIEYQAHTKKEPRIYYQPFIQGNHIPIAWQDTRAVFSTLDEALAHAIAYRVEGPNTRADTYFIRSLNRE